MKCCRDMSWGSVVEKCWEGVLWRFVAPHKMKRSDVEKCCGEVLWRRCCEGVLSRSVVKERCGVEKCCCGEVL